MSVIRPSSATTINPNTAVAPTNSAGARGAKGDVGSPPGTRSSDSFERASGSPFGRLAGEENSAFGKPGPDRHGAVVILTESFPPSGERLSAALVDGELTKGELGPPRPVFQFPGIEGE